MRSYHRKYDDSVAIEENRTSWLVRILQLQVTKRTAECNYHRTDNRLAYLCSYRQKCFLNPVLRLRAPRLRGSAAPACWLLRNIPARPPVGLIFFRSAYQNFPLCKHKSETQEIRIFKKRVQYLYICITEEDYPMPRPRHSNYAGAVSSGCSLQPFFPFEAPRNHGAMKFQTFTMMLAINAQAARTKKICPTSYQCASLTSVSMKPAP